MAIDDRTRGEIERALGRRLDRRDFLRIAALGGTAAGTAALIAACGPGAASSAAGVLSAIGRWTECDRRGVGLGRARPAGRSRSATSAPRPGPLAGVRRGGRLHLRRRHAPPSAPASQIGGTHLPDRDHHRRTASPTRTGPPRSPASSSPTTRRPDARRLDARDRPTRSPTSARRTASRASRRSRRGSRTSSAARPERGRRPTQAVRRGRTTSSGASRTSSRSSWTCGARSRPTRSSAACSPTTATATPGATPTSGSRPPLRPAGYTLVDPGRYENLTDGLLGPDQRLQDGGRRDPHRRARSRPTSRRSGPRPPSRASSPRSPRSARRCCSRPRWTRSARTSATACRREVWWSPSHPFTSSLTGQIAKAARRRLHGRRPSKQWTQPIGFAPRPVRGRRGRPEADDERRRQGGDPRRDQGDRPRHDRRARSTGRHRPAAVRRDQRRQDAARRRPVGEGHGRSRTTSSSSATRTIRTSRRPARCEPIPAADDRLAGQATA